MAAAINVKILGDAGSLIREFRRAERSASGFNKSMTRSGTSSRKGQGAMRGLGSSVRLAGGAFLGGAGLVAGITSTLKKTAEFEKSLNTFQAVSGATAAQMTRVGAVAQKLGGDITLPATSAKDAALAMTELAKGGLTVRQAMAAAKGTLQLAAAGEVEVGEAATISAKALNAFGLSGDKAGLVADVLANAANASVGEISDFALGLQQSSASANAAGLSIQDTTTALALLAQKGIAGSDAGTSFKTMLARLVPSTKKAHEAMKDLGVSWSDSQGNLLPLRAQVDQYQSALAKLTPVQRQQAINTIFGSDASRAANIILGSGVTQYDKMHAAISRQGAAAELAKAKNKGLAGAMDALKSAVETVQIMIGTVLAPALTKYLQASARWLGDSKNQKTILTVLKSTLAGIATVLNIIRTAFHALSVVVGGNKNAVKALIAALIVLKVTMLGLGIAGRIAAFRALTGATRAATVATVAHGNAAKASAAKGALLRRSLVGKAGIVGAAGLAAFALTTLILKVTGLDKKLRAAGAAAFDLAAKVGLADDKGKQFEGKKILTGAESKRIRQQAARLEAGGLTPKQAAARIALNRPNVARRDIDVLAGVHGQRPVVNIHIDGRRDDAETVARKVTEAQRKHGKRNTTQRRGR